MDSCQLLRPDGLWLVLPLMLLLWIFSKYRTQAGNWQDICDAKLLPYILQGREVKTSRWPLVAIGLGGLLAILALSGPACEQREQPVFRDQSALVIALDLSLSMDSTDVKPSRLSRARLKLIDILKQRDEGQTALVAYAGQAFTVSPLTEDTDTIIALVKSLDSNLMPQQGSSISTAIEKSAELMQQAGVPKGDILLITDGADDNDLSRLFDKIKAYSHRISVLGIGTSTGAPIALPDGGFLKDSAGTIVIPKLNAGPLQKIAQQTHGRYHALSADEKDINYLLKSVITDTNNEEAVEGFNSDQWHEEGPWLLLALLPLAALAFRRGYLVVLLLIIMPIPKDVYAFDFQQLWLNKDQQAHQQLQQGKPESAAALFQTPEWKAAAHYRAGDYQQAIDNLNGIDTADAFYNKGNALAQLGNVPEAIKAFDRALELQADHEDAKYNRDLLKQQSEDQKDQEGQDDKQSQDNKQEQGDESSQAGDEQNGQGNQDKQDGQQGQQQGTQQQQDQNAQQEDMSEEQAKSEPEQEADQKKAEAMQEDSEEQPEEQSDSSTQEQSEKSETDIATEQWLRRIPDDPGGLMRRKFKYQYQRQPKKNNGNIAPW